MSETGQHIWNEDCTEHLKHCQEPLKDASEQQSGVTAVF